MKDIVRGDCRIHWTTRSTVEVFGKQVTYKRPITFPVLWINGKLAMSASPQEVLMMKEAAEGARGDALVGGLGLGLVLEHLKKKCKTITVVEKLPQVTELYKALRKPKKPLYDTVIHDTIENVLEAETSRKWDFIFVDTWFDGDYEFLPHLNWIEQEARRLLKPKGVVRLWHHEEMARDYLRECRRLFAMKFNIVGASAGNVEALARRFPLAGAFTKWFRANLDATVKEAMAEAARIAKGIQRISQPLEVVDDLRAVGL